MPQRLNIVCSLRAHALGCEFAAADVCVFVLKKLAGTEKSVRRNQVDSSIAPHVPNNKLVATRTTTRYSIPNAVLQCLNPVINNRREPVVRLVHLILHEFRRTKVGLRRPEALMQLRAAAAA